MTQIPGFVWPLVAPWDMDINIDLSCSRTTDMVLDSSLGLIVTMVPGGGKGHPYWHDSSGRVTWGPIYSLRSLPSPLESAWHSTSTGAMDINTDPGYCRTRVADMAPGSSPVWLSSWPWVANRPPPSVYSSLPSPWSQVSSRPLTSVYSLPFWFLPFCVFPQCMNHCVPHSLPFLHRIFAYHNKVHMPGTTRLTRPHLSRNASGRGGCLSASLRLEDPSWLDPVFQISLLDCFNNILLLQTF